MNVISVFFQWFGFFAFIGIIACWILIARENKKQLPNEAEKKELVERQMISADCKDKKVLRQVTMQLRTEKAVLKQLGLLQSEEIEKEEDSIDADK